MIQRGVLFFAAALALAAAAVVALRVPYRPPAPTGPFMPASLVLDGAALARSGVTLGAAQRDLLVRLVYPTERSGRLARRTGSATAPVLLYLPGWPGTEDDNPGLVGDLASHGFVVAALRHVQARPDLDRPMDFSTAAASRDTLLRADAKAALGVQDAIVVLDALGRLDAAGGAPPFQHVLRLSQVGIIGFSFGGAVAASACARDARFVAAANMDGWLFGDGVGLSFPQPYLFISDDEPAMTAIGPAAAGPARGGSSWLDARDLRLIRERLTRPGGYVVTIRGSVHESFADAQPHTSIWRRNVPGPARGRRISRIVRLYVNAFFDRYLLHEPAPLLDRRTPPLSGAVLDISTS